MKKQNKPYFHRKQYILLALLALIGVIAAVGGVSAKYVLDIGDTSAVVRAKEFYFSSDLLKAGGMEYTLNPGTESIILELRNHDDSLRFSEGDISYQVTVDNGATVTILEEPTKQKLTGGTRSTHKIQISNLQNGVTYIVTAKGTAGYEKTLSATFTVKPQNEIAYKYLEMDPSGAFVLLTVWTENLSGQVTLSIPAGVIPDATDNALGGIQNYSADDGKYQEAKEQIVGPLDAYSSHTYRFFLEVPFTMYRADQFTVIVGDTPATEKTPN